MLLPPEVSDPVCATPPSFHVTSHTCWVRRPDRFRVPVPVPEPVVLVWQEVAVAVAGCKRAETNRDTPVAAKMRPTKAMTTPTARLRSRSTRATYAVGDHRSPAVRPDLPLVSERPWS